MARSYEDEFTEETVKEAWIRAEGRCDLCNKQLVYKNRDKDFEDTAWNAHHKKNGRRRRKCKFKKLPNSLS